MIALDIQIGLREVLIALGLLIYLAWLLLGRAGYFSETRFMRSVTGRALVIVAALLLIVLLLRS